MHVYRVRTFTYATYKMWLATYGQQVQKLPQPDEHTHRGMPLCILPVASVEYLLIHFWGGVGVSLTTAENKLFLYRVLCVDVCFNLKKVIIQYG